MQYMLLIYDEEKKWEIAGKAAHCDAQCDAAKVAQDLAAKGQYLLAAPLEPTRLTRSVRVTQGRPLVTDGPFAETREQLGGFFLIDVNTVEEATQIATRIMAMHDGVVEIRPVMPMVGLPEPFENRT